MPGANLPKKSGKSGGEGNSDDTSSENISKGMFGQAYKPKQNTPGKGRPQPRGLDGKFGSKVG